MSRRSHRAARALIRGSSRGRSVRLEDVVEDGDDVGPSGYHPKTRSSSRTRAAGFEADYDDGDGAGTSGGVRPKTRASKRARTKRIVVPDYDTSDSSDGASDVNPPPRPRAASSDVEVGGSEWEMASDDSCDDRTYVPQRRPENLSGRGGICDSDTTTEEESDLDDMDYVRVHDSTLDSVMDSDLPLKFRCAKLAQINAPGTDHFVWRYSQEAYVRRNAFSGEPLLYS